MATGARAWACRKVAKDLADLAGNWKPAELGRHHFEALKNAWQKHYSQATQHQLTNYLRMLARWMGIDAVDVPKVRQPRPRTVIITPEELQRALAAAPAWLRVFITFCTALGLRHAEALDVKETGYNPINHTISFKAKGGDIQTMPTTPDIEAIIEAAPPGPAEMGIVERYKGSPIGRGMLWHHWKQLRKKAGIRPEVTIHDLRRTAAVTAYEFTKDIRFVWQLLRHRNLATTARYLEHVDTNKMRQILAELWSPTKGETVQ
jgi:integrase